MDWTNPAWSAWAANVLALCNAAAAFAICVYTAKLTQLNKILADETRRMRESSERADVSAAVMPNAYHGSVIEFHVMNSGKASALSVVIETSIENQKTVAPYSTPKKLEIANLLPGGTVRAFLGVGSDLGADAIVTISVSYRDGFGAHANQTIQRIGGWFGGSRINDQPSVDIAKSLQNIERTLSDLGRGWASLSVNVADQSERAAAEIRARSSFGDVPPWQNSDAKSE